MGFGAEIKALRLAIGEKRGEYMSQEKLANILGITRQTLFAYEKEVREPPLYFIEALKYLRKEPK